MLVGEVCSGGGGGGGERVIRVLENRVGESESLSEREGCEQTDRERCVCTDEEQCLI